MLVIVGGGLREGFLRSPTVDGHAANKHSIQNKSIELVEFICHYAFNTTRDFLEYRSLKVVSVRWSATWSRRTLRRNESEKERKERVNGSRSASMMAKMKSD